MHSSGIAWRALVWIEVGGDVHNWFIVWSFSNPIKWYRLRTCLVLVSSHHPLLSALRTMLIVVVVALQNCAEKSRSRTKQRPSNANLLLYIRSIGIVEHSARIWHDWVWEYWNQFSAAEVDTRATIHPSSCIAQCGMQMRSQCDGRTQKFNLSYNDVDWNRWQWSRSSSSSTDEWRKYSIGYIPQKILQSSNAFHCGFLYCFIKFFVRMDVIDLFAFNRQDRTFGLTFGRLNSVGDEQETRFE